MTRPQSGPAWLGFLILLSLVVAACGQVTPLPGGPTPTVTVPPGLPVVVTLAGRVDQDTLAFLDEQIAAFEAANPDVRVEILSTPRDAAERQEWFATRLQQRDRTVDILLLDETWLTRFAANGWLAPLDAYARLYGVRTDDFFPATVQANTIAGRLMALPWAADVGVLYFRRDLLDRYGYDPPATWADLQRIALDLKAREGVPYGFVWQGALYESLTCNVLEYVWAYGGDVLDESGKVVFASPQTRAALQQMRDMVASGASPQEITTYNEGKSLRAFENGEAAFLRTWSYAWNQLNAADSPAAGKAGVAPLPASCLAGQSLALSASSLHPGQAFRFMAFLVGYEQQVQLARQTGQRPTLAAAYRHQALAGDPFFSSLSAALAVAHPRPQTAAYPQVSEAISSEVNRMLAGQQDAVTTAANVQQRIEAVLPRP